MGYEEITLRLRTGCLMYHLSNKLKPDYTQNVFAKQMTKQRLSLKNDGSEFKREIRKDMQNMVSLALFLLNRTNTNNHDTFSMT